MKQIIMNWESCKATLVESQNDAHMEALVDRNVMQMLSSRPD